MTYPIDLQNLRSGYTFFTDKQNWINSFELAKATSLPYAEKLATVFNHGLANYFGVKEPRFTPINATILVTILSAATLGSLYLAVFGSKKTEKTTPPPAEQPKPVKKTDEKPAIKVDELTNNRLFKDAALHLELLMTCPIEHIAQYVELGVNTETQDVDNNSALTLLAEKSKTNEDQYLPRIAELLKCKANPLTINGAFKRPFELCRQSGPVYELLEKAAEDKRK